jgi:hypothetical protein
MLGVVIMPKTVKIVVWRQGEDWLGYFQDFPDYWTQGKTQEDLRNHLRSLYNDLTSGEIPSIRKVEDFVVS